MPFDRWRERAAWKARTRDEVRRLSSLPFPEYADIAEDAAADARDFLEAHERSVREGRIPATRAGFAKLYREAHALMERLIAADLVLDEEDPFHLFGATTDRLRRAFPFITDEEARRFVILKLHDFSASAEPALPLRGAIAEHLFQASMDYHRLVALKRRTLKEPREALQDVLEVLARYAPAYAGVPESEVPAFQALPLERRLSLVEGAGSLGRPTRG